MVAIISFATFLATRPNDGLCGVVEALNCRYADGCATFPVGNVEGWFVDPDMRLQSIGRAFVRASERWAVGRGCIEMASDTHLENTVSMHAYKAIGFEESS